MVALDYRQLALSWQPASDRDAFFNKLATGALILALILSVVLSSIPVPKEPPVVRAKVPERVARYIKERPKPPRAAPKVEQPRPPEQIVSRPQRAERKPLTAAEEKARARVQDKGLVALSGELATLADASRVNAMAARTLTGGASTKQAATLDTGILNGDARGTGQGPAVAQTLRAGTANAPKLEQGQGGGQALLAKADTLKGSGAQPGGQAAGRKGGGGRGNEDVAIVMDKYKSALYSLYNRARRNNPSLKGKIVLVITILPSGKVSNVVMKSNELNAPELEASLLARVRQFDFGPVGGEPFTVTVPVEFVPS